MTPTNRSPHSMPPNGVPQSPTAPSSTTPGTAQDFATGHMTGALDVPADGRLAETADMVLQPDDEVVVMASDGHA